MFSFHLIFFSFVFHSSLQVLFILCFHSSCKVTNGTRNIDDRSSDMIHFVYHVRFPRLYMLTRTVSIYFLFISLIKGLKQFFSSSFFFSHQKKSWNVTTGRVAAGERSDFTSFFWSSDLASNSSYVYFNLNSHCCFFSFFFLVLLREIVLWWKTNWKMRTGFVLLFQFCSFLSLLVISLHVVVYVMSWCL